MRRRGGEQARRQGDAGRLFEGVPEACHGLEALDVHLVDVGHDLPVVLELLVRHLGPQPYCQSVMSAYTTSLSTATGQGPDPQQVCLN